MPVTTFTSQGVFSLSQRHFSYRQSGQDGARSPSLGTDLTECVAGLGAQIRRVQGGDLSGAEAMLTAQATALNVCSREWY